LALGDLRVAGALMLAAGVAKSAMHVHAGVPCPLRTVTGIPCPLCGMTTSVTAAVHGDLGAAIAANPAGPLLVVAVVALLAIRHRDSIDVPRWSLPVALALMWVWELARFNLI
jgi:hypothetical protein